MERGGMMENKYKPHNCKKFVLGECSLDGRTCKCNFYSCHKKKKEFLPPEVPYIQILHPVKPN